MPDRGTATPTFMQLEHFPWYTTVTYSGLQTDKALALIGCFPSTVAPDRSKTDAGFCFLVFFLSNFSFLLSDLSGFDSLCIAGHRKGSNFWKRRLILAQERCFLGPAVHVLVAPYLV